MFLLWNDRALRDVAFQCSVTSAVGLLPDGPVLMYSAWRITKGQYALQRQQCGALHTPPMGRVLPMDADIYPFF